MRARWWTLIGVLIFGALAWGAVTMFQVAQAARSGQRQLDHAASELSAEHFAAANADLVAARASFHRMDTTMHDLGPLLPVLKMTPVARVQVRALDRMAAIGDVLVNAGLQLNQSAQQMHTASAARLPVSASLDQLRSAQTTLSNAVSVLDTARRDAAELQADRLLGPIATARDLLNSRLATTERRAVRGDAGLRILLDMIGANGPRRILIVSQNPDEVRPTGGYMGTYGVMTANDGHVVLSRYGSMGNWVSAHRGAVIPVSRAPAPFTYATPPQPLQLANTNTTPDWPSSANLAMRLWQQGGEQPVDGVFSMDPELMVRIVTVLGPVYVPSYNQTVTAANLVNRLNYYTHSESQRTNPNRKRFIAELARAIVLKVFNVRSGAWLPLGHALSAGFGAGEAMLWTRDGATQTLLSELGWSDAIPRTPGDFYADAEFEYAAKNGGALRRVFDHVVTLRADGSGTSATTMVLRDTAPAAPGYNDDSLSYIAPYGPRFSVLDASSDPPQADQPDLAGHPAAGFFRAAQPLGSTHLRVVWRGPGLALRRSDGALVYRLEFRGQPGHRGDVLHLSVQLPTGWHWAGPPPPTTVHLYGTYSGEWVLDH